MATNRRQRRKQIEQIEVTPNALDRLVGYLSPKRGFNRLQYRQACAMLSGYEAADKGSRYNRKRENTGGSGDEHIDDVSLFELRESSRDLDRNNGLSQSLLDRCNENVIGPAGFRLKPLTGDKDLNKRITEDWQEWLPTADMRGEFEFWQLMRKVYLSRLRDGDHWIQLLDNELQINAFEADRILNPVGATAINGMKLVHGVAKDKSGIKRWLFVSNDCPTHGVVRPDEGRVIRAENVLHYYDPRRITLTRGIPITTPLIREFDDIDDLMLCNRVGAKVLAAQGFVITTEDPGTMAEFMKTELLERDGNTERIEEFEPLSVNYLRTGEEMKSVESNRPGNNFFEFMTLLNRYVGLPLGLPLELVLLDFSNVNFASSRQLLNQAQRRFRIEQNGFGLFNSKIYRWWLKSRIDAGFYSANSEQTRNKLFRHRWGFPGWPSPNPLQDVMATQIAIDYGFGSRTNYADQHGIDIDAIFDDLQDEKKGLSDRKLVLLAMARIQASANEQNKLLDALRGTVLNEEDQG